MSVNTTRMSGGSSRIAIASSALPASTTLKPASPIISGAFIRCKNSSSTMRTTGRLIAEVLKTHLLLMLSKCRRRDSFRGARTFSFIDAGLMFAMDPAQRTRLKSAIETHISKAKPRKSGAKKYTKPR
jgi:hypothetical protein